MWGRRWECFLNFSSLYRHLIHWSPSSTHPPTVFSITSHFLCFIIFVFSPTCSLMPENISQACELFFQPPPSSLIGDACVCWVDKAGSWLKDKFLHGFLLDLGGHHLFLVRTCNNVVPPAKRIA